MIVLYKKEPFHVIKETKLYYWIKFPDYNMYGADCPITEGCCAACDNEDEEFPGKGHRILKSACLKIITRSKVSKEKVDKFFKELAI